MSRLTRVAALAATLFLLGGAATWFWGDYVSHRHRGVVSEKPIRFQDGFALEQSFNVEVLGTHFLAIGYEKNTVVDTRLPNPLSADEFSVEYRVSSGGTTIVQGTAVNPGFVILRKDYTTRVLAKFEAEPGSKYDLSLKVVRAASILVPTNPKVLILANPQIPQMGEFDQGIARNYAILLLIAASLLGIPVLRFYVRRLQTKERERTGVVAAN